VVDTLIGGVRVVRELERLVIERDLPGTIVSDNGCELTSSAVLRWSLGRLDWHYIAPGKPVQNAFVESFNSPLLGCREHSSSGSKNHRAKPMG
jgi:putative transposase